jgi:predicted AlkP superfamily phosphohydrolase/phosphomutase
MFSLDRVKDGVDYVLPWTYATDLSYVQIAEHMMRGSRYDLAMVYIQGTDTCCHRFWSFRENSSVLHRTLVEYNLLPEEEETYRRYFSETIDRYYEFADELVGRLLACIDKDTVVVVCSDHGFGPWIDDGRERWIGHTFSGSHRNEGSIILWGPGIRRGKRLPDDSPPYIWDVAPTVLALMDLPLAADMPGSPITDSFDSRLRQRYRPDFVASYDVNYKAGERPEMVPMSAEYEERLRSLGYIQ